VVFHFFPSTAKGGEYENSAGFASFARKKAPAIKWWKLFPTRSLQPPASSPGNAEGFFKGGLGFMMELPLGFTGVMPASVHPCSGKTGAAISILVECGNFAALRKLD